jgi:hypothetical protein
MGRRRRVRRAASETLRGGTGGLGAERAGEEKTEKDTGDAGSGKAGGGNGYVVEPHAAAPFPAGRRAAVPWVKAVAVMLTFPLEEKIGGLYEWYGRKFGK